MPGLNQPGNQPLPKHAGGAGQKDSHAIIVGLAERDGTIYAPEGLDVQAVLQWRENTGSLKGFPDATTLDDARVCLELDCDILVPAALQNQITAENAGRIKAPLSLHRRAGLLRFVA